MITPIEKQADPPAVSAARQIVAEMTDELQRRADLHQRLFAAVWKSGDYTPSEFFDALGTRGEAFMNAAGLNVQSIAQLAPCFGKSLNDYLRTDDYTPPVEYSVLEGVVTINE